jgi:hypothetical protein
VSFPLGCEAELFGDIVVGSEVIPGLDALEVSTAARQLPDCPLSMLLYVVSSF